MLILFLLLLRGTPAQSEDRPKPEVRLVVKPSSCLEPCAITASITIAGYEPEREVCVAIYDQGMEADDPNRRSCWPWSGREITDVDIANIPAGNYTIVAALTEAGKRDTARLIVGGEQ